MGDSKIPSIPPAARQWGVGTVGGGGLAALLWIAAQANGTIADMAKTQAQMVSEQRVTNERLLSLSKQFESERERTEREREKLEARIRELERPTR